MKNCFFQLLAVTIIDSIKHSENLVLKVQVINIGHFNRRVFNHEKILHQNGISFFRFLLCLAMAMKEKEFRKMMEKLTDFFIEAANSSLGDEALKEYFENKKKSKNI